MIVVAGGTGTLGAKLVPLLVERHPPVRVLTRDPARARHLEGAGLEVVVGDVRNRDSVAAALEGASTIISSIHGFIGPGDVSPMSVDRDGNANLIEAAKANGSEFILVSAAWVCADHPWELARAKYAAEQNLQRSGLRWTIVRPTVFTETWGNMMLTSVSTSGRILVFGRGNNPANHVSVIDVAALVERAVADPNLRGRIIEFGGPDELTSNQLAGIVQEVAGRPSKVRHIPRPALRLMGLAAAPFKPQLARMARASLILDTFAQPFDPTPSRAEFADLPETNVMSALKLVVQETPR
jgi:NADH dehydrogenase